jgi:hypothetical protein
MIGHPVAGASLGSSLGASLSKWLGAGDYSVSQNSIVQRAASSVPMMHSTNQTTVIRHRELVCQVTGSTTFSVVASLVLNPGLSTSFPWLSGIAQQYQEYAWKGLVFHFVPTSGSAVSNTSAALGSVMIQTSYRSNDSAPTSKISMMNEYWANEVVPFESMAHPIECDPKENPFQIHYVRGGTIPSGDPLLYDTGVTYVAVQGQQSAYALGDLWVTYEVELKKPLISSNVTSLNDMYQARFSGTSAALPFDTATSWSFTGSLPITTTTAGAINIPSGLPGIFNVNVMFAPSGSFTGFNMSSAPTYSNAAGYNFGGSAVSTLGMIMSGGTTTVASYCTQFQVTDPTKSAIVTLPTPGITGAVAATHLEVSYIPLA